MRLIRCQNTGEYGGKPHTCLHPDKYENFILIGVEDDTESAECEYCKTAEEEQDKPQ